MTTQISTPAANPVSKAKRGGLVAGLGAGAVMLACAAACAIPLVAAAGVAAGGGALIAGAWPVALGVLQPPVCSGTARPDGRALSRPAATRLRLPRAAAVETADAREPIMRDITRDELVDLLHVGSAVVVEALPERHYKAEHIATAVNLPGPLTPEIAAQLAPELETTIVTYCSGFGCTRSKAAAIAFEKLGYTDVRVYSGGKTDWFDAGLPLVSAAQSSAA